MSDRPTVLVVSANRERSAQILTLVAPFNIEAVVAGDTTDAVWRLGDRSFDMIISDTDLEGKSGCQLLAQARQHHPDMQRVLIENAPVTMSWHALINEVAPAAIFPEMIDAPRVAELLKITDEDEDEEDKRLVHDGSEDAVVAEIAADLAHMMRDTKVELPVLPEIAKKVDSLLVDEKNSFREIAEWVRREQSMAARILQVANSPIYCAREPIRNLSQAVSRLGLRELRQLLQAVIVENLFRTKVPSRRDMMRDLWVHSLSTGYCNERIAQFLRMPDSEDYFLMGILHDIGKLLILHLIEEGFNRRMWPETKLTPPIIERICMRKHNKMGKALVERWSYPKVFQEVIGCHNDAGYADYHSEPVIVTHFSNLVTRKIGFTIFPHDGKQLTPSEIAQALNMTQEVQERLEASLLETVDMIRSSCFADWSGSAKGT